MLFRSNTVPGSPLLSPPSDAPPQQKRKTDSVSLTTQPSPVTSVACLPGAAEASQASVYPAVRDTNTFGTKARDDHEQRTSLTTVTTSTQKGDSLVAMLLMLSLLLVLPAVVDLLCLPSLNPQNGTARRLLPSQPGRKRKANCGGTDEVQSRLSRAQNPVLIIHMFTVKHLLFTKTNASQQRTNQSFFSLFGL